MIEKKQVDNSQSSRSPQEAKNSILRLPIEDPQRFFPFIGKEDRQTLIRAERDREHSRQVEEFRSTLSMRVNQFSATSEERILIPELFSLIRAIVDIESNCDSSVESGLYLDEVARRNIGQYEIMFSNQVDCDYFRFEVKRDTKILIQGSGPNELVFRMAMKSGFPVEITYSIYTDTKAGSFLQIYQELEKLFP